MSEDNHGKEKNERSLSGVHEEQGENERSLSEVLSEVLVANDYKKMKDVIIYLEENNSITPQVAEQITKKSASTARRYLKMLVDTGYVKVDGSTNNIRYTIRK